MTRSASSAARESYMDRRTDGYARVATIHRPCFGCRAVRRIIIDNDDFPTNALESCSDTLDQLAQIPALVEGWDYHGQFRRLHRHCLFFIYDHIALVRCGGLLCHKLHGNKGILSLIFSKLSGTTTAAPPRGFLRGAHTAAPVWSETPPARPSGRTLGTCTRTGPVPVRSAR